jgi:hypothetical protein
MCTKIYFLKIIKINFNFMRLLTLYPFKMTSDYRIVYSRRQDNINLLLRLLFFVLGFICISFGKTRVHELMHLDLFWVAHTFLIFHMFFMAIIVAIINKIQVSSSLKLWNDLISINEILIKLKIHPNYKKIYKCYVIRLIIDLGIILSYSIIFVIARSLNFHFPFSVLTIMPFTYIIVNTISFSVTNCFVTSLCLIVLMLRELTSKLKVNENPSWKNYLKVVRETAMVHQKLCEIIRLVNKILSMQLLFLIFFYFVMFSLNAFYVVTRISERKVDSHVILSGFWVGISIRRFLTFIILGSKCTNQVRGFVR